MPATLVVRIMGQQARRDFQAVRFWRVAHQPSIVATGPDPMLFIYEQRLRIDGTDAADIPPLASVKVIDDEVIARIAHGVQQTAVFIVQKTAATFFRDQRVPPQDAIVAGIESKQRGAAKAALRIMP